MESQWLDVGTVGDGSVVVRPRGDLGADAAVDLRQVLVQVVRRVRPCRMVLDLAQVASLDPINVGTLAATCEIGDEHRVVVFIDNAPAALATSLARAGVPGSRMRCTRA